MRSRDLKGFVGKRTRIARWCALLGLWLGFVSLQGCARGDLELLIDDIKRFYLNGGFHGGASKMSSSDADKMVGDPAEEALLKVVIEQVERYANVQAPEGREPVDDVLEDDPLAPRDTDLR